jgi:hypothetical protein
LIVNVLALESTLSNSPLALFSAPAACAKGTRVEATHAQSRVIRTTLSNRKPTVDLVIFRFLLSMRWNYM